MSNSENKNEPGKRYDKGKLRFDLIPPEWESALAAILTKGSEKYAERNWERGMSWSRVYGPVRRHLNKFWAGKDLDEETGLPHLAHAAWGCLALLTFMTTHPELDDRVKGTFATSPDMKVKDDKKEVQPPAAPSVG